MCSTNIVCNPGNTHDIQQLNKINNDEEIVRFEEKIKDALREIREDDNIKRQCLQHLREWVKNNRDIENCLIDENFLLKFLRFSKYSVMIAEQTILKYLSFRKIIQQYTYNMDYHNGTVLELFTKGFVVVSPFRDSNGRRVIIYNVGKFDPHKYNNIDFCRPIAITFETLLTESTNQIFGVNHVIDCNGINPAIATILPLSEIVTIITKGETSFPLKHKEINIVNLPTSLKFIYDFVLSLIKNDKLKKRFMIHKTMKDFQKNIDLKCLPKEQGGIMPMKDMIELWKKELATKRELLLSYDKIKLLSEEGIMRRKSRTPDKTGVGSLPGSFRKLEVD